jgi:hypothetical protein
MTNQTLPIEPAPDELQHINREIILQLRLLQKDLNMSTGKISAAVVEAIRATIQGDQKRAEERIGELESMFEQLSLRWTTSINGLSNFFAETGKTLRNRKVSKPSKRE